MGLVSIVVPVYNVENKLRKCIESIINQTYNNIKIILVNDGSTDKSGIICDYYSSIDDRISTIHISNSGVSKARNTGLKKVETRYVIFVDSDDEIKENMVELYVKELVIGEFDFILSGYERVFYENRSKTNEKIRCKKFNGSTYDFLCNINDYIKPPLLQSPCWKMFDVSIINKYNIFFIEDMNYGEDTMFVYNYLQYTNNIKAIDETLYSYNAHSSTTLSKKFRSDKFDINLRLANKLKDLLNEFEITDKEDFICEMVSGHFISYLRDIWENQNTMSKEEIYYMINKSISNIQTKKAFKFLKNKNIQSRVVNIFILMENPKLIFIYISLKENIRIKSKFIFSILNKLK